MSAVPGRFPSAAILLAGGAARRMGGHPKLLLSIDGESLLQRAIRLARAVQAAPILVVLGGHAESYRAHLADADGAPDVELIDNPQWAEGLGASLRCGIAALPPNRPPEATFFVLAPDQPLVSVTQLHRLQDALRDHPEATAAACDYAGTPGVPVLFRYVWRHRLLGAHGDIGARRYLREYRHEVTTLPFPKGACDIDTEEDYIAFLRR
ncbi:NTP transferase domain-containing protein [Chloracidobacterium aggregatum]|uniref:Nucleotidyltransferase family protein n=1 Tax=Chloracidobacterium sp. N TaxID=2821540 RepID=A0ABX8B3N0_9BACT|nr:nucleotidyltransferase family protein [Chloracidobacterium aggregatum]QUV85900.1 nucleotidyltransferase family protein [Chloracidobacterium sp. 2]QUV89676.1 nucleotidyltransferase family protein [Chloracidobacterium sp. S]QUV92330.1 nucleotidyltransferase family protein [Chloracidobacterium sp. A]QUV95605.1 nucleotidyltransferase family protein [Chloracidobacterium sp. N]QUV98828.1 nucleotidyltransferase family protein [Chloracidobacterium sp. E]